MTPIEKLDSNCTDYSIHMRDWPKHGFRYVVTAIHFCEYARCVGHTLEQAVDRAIDHLNKSMKSRPSVDLDEVLNILNDPTSNQPQQ